MEHDYMFSFCDDVGLMILYMDSISYWVHNIIYICFGLILMMVFISWYCICLLRWKWWIIYLFMFVTSYMLFYDKDMKLQFSLVLYGRNGFHLGVSHPISELIIWIIVGKEVFSWNCHFCWMGVLVDWMMKSS